MMFFWFCGFVAKQVRSLQAREQSAVTPASQDLVMLKTSQDRRPGYNVRKECAGSATNLA